MPAPTIPDQRLATVVRRLRQEREQTIEGVGYGAGLVATTITRVEGGRVDPGWTTVCAIAEALGLPLAELGRLIEAEGPRT